MAGDLKQGEFRPAASSAAAWIRAQPDLHLWVESFASCAIEGNRNAELCGETLRRLLAGEGVSDRYILGLAWTMRHSESKSMARRKSSLADTQRKIIEAAERRGYERALAETRAEQALGSGQA